MNNIEKLKQRATVLGVELVCDYVDEAILNMATETSVKQIKKEMELADNKPFSISFHHNGEKINKEICIRTEIGRLQKLMYISVL